MIDADAAALLTCAVFAAFLWYSSPTRSLSAPAWLAFFSVLCFKDELWSTAAESIPWLPPLMKISICIFFLILSIYIACSRLFGKGSTTSCGITPKNTEHGESKHMLRPLFFPARTTHTRFFPQKHSFSYSYLLVGIPVGWRGALRSYIAVDLPSDSPESWTGFFTSWFSVNADDYLDRGSESLGLQGKLQTYLKSQVGRL